MRLREWSYQLEISNVRHIRCRCFPKMYKALADLAKDVLSSPLLLDPSSTFSHPYNNPSLSLWSHNNPLGSWFAVLDSVGGMNKLIFNPCGVNSFCPHNQPYLCHLVWSQGKSSLSFKCVSGHLELNAYCACHGL